MHKTSIIERLPKIEKVSVNSNCDEIHLSSFSVFVDLKLYS